MSRESSFQGKFEVEVCHWRRQRSVFIICLENFKKLYPDTEPPHQKQYDLKSLSGISEYGKNHKTEMVRLLGGLQGQESWKL